MPGSHPMPAFPNVSTRPHQHAQRIRHTPRIACLRPFAANLTTPRVHTSHCAPLPSQATSSRHIRSMQSCACRGQNKCITSSLLHLPVLKFRPRSYTNARKRGWTRGRGRRHPAKDCKARCSPWFEEPAISLFTWPTGSSLNLPENLHTTRYPLGSMKQTLMQKTLLFSGLSNGIQHYEKYFVT